MEITFAQDYMGHYVAVDSDTYCGCIDCLSPVGIGDSEEEAKENLMEQLNNIDTDNDLYSFDDIKQEWRSSDTRHSLDVYVRKNYTPVYNDELDFIGFEKGTIQ